MGMRNWVEIDGENESAPKQRSRDGDGKCAVGDWYQPSADRSLLRSRFAPVAITRRQSSHATAET